ncbi:hypothetical protein EYF80_040034 [Liparis tanakae]|uniref:Uncharacterized protein n=1 Tax=Liparis tanakae TaxID=230148 RepID=A0A4Z2GAW9_9TELE|nr:hypothetical protein EYF80_040034 [Liparis tanakae]
MPSVLPDFQTNCEPSTGQPDALRWEAYFPPGTGHLARGGGKQSGQSFREDLRHLSSGGPAPPTPRIALLAESSDII